MPRYIGSYRFDSLPSRRRSCWSARLRRSAAAATLLLKDGRTLEGRYAQVASVAENPLAPKTQAGEVAAHAADCGRRRPAPHVHPQQPGARGARRELGQRRADQHLAAGGRARRGGRPHRRGHARRRRSTSSAGASTRCSSTEGPLAVVQGITQITPLYTKVEGLMGGPRPIVWDMRIATSSIPRDTLQPRPLDVREAGRSGRPAADRAALLARASAIATPARSWSRSSRTFPSGRICSKTSAAAPARRAADPQRDPAPRRSRAAPTGSRPVRRNFPPKASPAKRCSRSASCLDKYAAEDERRRKLLGSDSTTRSAKIADENGRRLAEDLPRRSPPKRTRTRSSGWRRSSDWPTTRR